jgi:enoyl-CoA hydratase/carnithine racemase
MSSILRSPHPAVHTIDVSKFDYSSYGFVDVKVQLDNDSGVLVLTLNRPDRHNAFTNEMCHSIVFCMELADKDDRVRVVVMTGAGKSFCAGAELSQGFGADTSLPMNAHRDGGGQSAGAVLRCRKREYQ